MTVIKIKRGPGAPTTSALTSFEPGFSTDNENLYINNAGSMVRIGHKTYTGSSAPDSSLGENGDFYTQLTTSSSSVTTSNDFLQKVDGEWLSVGGGGGGGNTNYLELTQAEYNALTPEEKNNGTIYFITDASSQSIEAKLEDLDDVAITSPSDGDVLAYVASSSLWVNAPSGGGGSGHNYSTTEHEIGTWVDGSTLYEISISVAVDKYSPNSYDVPAGLALIVYMDGMAWTGGISGNAAALGYYVSANDRFQAYYDSSTRKIKVSESSSWPTNTVGYITIRYIKSS